MVLVFCYPRIVSLGSHHANEADPSMAEEDTAHLTELQARGVSATRAALALKRPKAQIVVRARQMGIPFPSLLELRKREKEIGASPMAS